MSFCRFLMVVLSSIYPLFMTHAQPTQLVGGLTQAQGESYGRFLHAELSKNSDHLYRKLDPTIRGFFEDLYSAYSKDSELPELFRLSQAAELDQHAESDASVRSALEKKKNGVIISALSGLVARIEAGKIPNKLTDGSVLHHRFDIVPIFERIDGVPKLYVRLILVDRRVAKEEGFSDRDVVEIQIARPLFEPDDQTTYFIPGDFKLQATQTRIGLFFLQ